MRRPLTAALIAALVSGSAAADASLARHVKSGSLITPPTVMDPAFQTEVLRAHNVERVAVGVAPLAWSPELATAALVWAKRLAAANTMAHDSQRTYGENLWTNRAGMRTVGSMVGGWSIEKTYYIPGAAHPNTSRTGDWHSVGHYQQMVWSSTRAVGCAIARSATNDFLVCRYWPVGNWRGQMAYDPRKVPRAVAGPAAKATPVAAPVRDAAGATASAASTGTRPTGGSAGPPPVPAADRVPVPGPKPTTVRIR